MSITSFLYENKVSSIMCIDPGQNTGWAFFKSIVGEGCYLQNDVFKAPRTFSEEKAHHFLMCSFSHLIEFFKPGKIFLESTSFWSTSNKSNVSASSGSLLKLDRVLGGYMCVCGLLGVDYSLLPVSHWKGQMNKEQTKLRLQRAKPDLKIKNEHIIDAVAMGFSLGGEL